MSAAFCAVCDWRDFAAATDGVDAIGGGLSIEGGLKTAATNALGGGVLMQELAFRAF
jgi:hypothetical protein